MADALLTITIPEGMITRTLAAFNTIADTHMTMECTGSQNMPDGSDFHGHWDFRIAPKETAETTKQFGQRVLRELGKAIINMVDKAEDETRYRIQVSAVVPPASNVPDDVLI